MSLFAISAAELVVFKFADDIRLTPAAGASPNSHTLGKGQLFILFSVKYF